MRELALLAFISLGACASAQPTPPPGPADACLPATLSQFTGQPVTADLGARMLRVTGKTVLRWVKPGMMVTMDYSEDRLTVYLDAANRVERASCG